MPKRRLYDPILVEESRKKGHNDAATTTTERSQAASSNRSNTTPSSSRKSRRIAANNNNKQQRQSLESSNRLTSAPVISSNSNRRSSQILIKLSDACLNHQNDTHPSAQRGRSDDKDAGSAAATHSSRGHGDYGKEDDIPSSCQSALSKLESLLPKLQREIPPLWIGSTVVIDSEIDSEETKQSFPTTAQTKEFSAILDDILLLCDFYVSVLSGYYCPYLPRLFHQGRHVGCGEFCIQ
jgi:hypothetical protein